jgi:hypothetical protein
VWIVLNKNNMYKDINIVKKFHNLTYLGESPKTSRCRRAIFKCDCGNIKSIAVANVLREDRPTKTCGCSVGISAKTRMTKHGDYRSVEYKTWKSIKRRCYNLNEPQFKDYGGRGLTVCDRWLEDYENFLADMGRRPSSKHSIDRIDNNKGYFPENCRWVTRDIQNSNTRKTVFITHAGITLTRSGWARILKVDSATLRDRLKKYSLASLLQASNVEEFIYNKKGN